MEKYLMLGLAIEKEEYSAEDGQMKYEKS